MRHHRLIDCRVRLTVLILGEERTPMRLEMMTCTNDLMYCSMEWFILRVKNRSQHRTRRWDFLYRSRPFNSNQTTANETGWHDHPATTPETESFAPAEPESSPAFRELRTPRAIWPERSRSITLERVAPRESSSPWMIMIT